MSMRKTASARTAGVPLVLASGLALLPAFAAAPSSQAPRVESRLEILSIATGAREVVWSADAHFEAPNWSRDGRSLIFNQGGRLYEFALAARTPRLLDTGTATRCNNDHGLSPDGRWLALSHAHEGTSLIYVVAAAGGTPRLVTPKGPSYWHGWSPDGLTLAYCARRDGEYRRLYDSGRRRRRDSSDDRARPRRRAGLRAGRPHLVQFGADRRHEDLAHGPRRT